MSRVRSDANTTDSHYMHADYSTPGGPPPSSSMSARLDSFQKKKNTSLSPSSTATVSPPSHNRHGSIGKDGSSFPSTSSSSDLMDISGLADSRKSDDGSQSGDSEKGNTKERMKKKNKATLEQTEYTHKPEPKQGCVFDYAWDKTTVMEELVFQEAYKILLDNKVTEKSERIYDIILTKLYVFLYKKMYVYVHLNDCKQNDFFTKSKLDTSKKLEKLYCGVLRDRLRRLLITLLFNDNFNGDFLKSLKEEERSNINELKGPFSGKQAMIHLNAKHKKFLKYIYIYSKQYKLVTNSDFIKHCVKNGRNKYVWISFNTENSELETLLKESKGFEKSFDDNKSHYLEENKTVLTNLNEENEETNHAKIERVKEENQEIIQSKKKGMSKQQPFQAANIIYPDIIGWNLCNNALDGGWKDILLINITIPRLSSKDSDSLMDEIQEAIINYVNDNHRNQEEIIISYQLKEVFIINPPLNFSDSLQANKFSPAAALSDENGNLSNEKTTEWKKKGFPSVISGLEAENAEIKPQYCSWQKNHAKLPSIRIIIPSSLLFISDFHEDGHIWIQYDLAWGFTIIIKKKTPLRLQSNKPLKTSNIRIDEMNVSPILSENNLPCSYWDYKPPAHEHRFNNLENIDITKCDMCRKGMGDEWAGSMDSPQTDAGRLAAAYTGCNYCERFFCKKCVKGYRDCYITNDANETDELWKNYYNLTVDPDDFVCPRCIYCHAVSCIHTQPHNRKQRSLRSSDPMFTEWGVYGTCEQCGISYHASCAKKHPECRYCKTKLVIENHSANEENDENMQIEATDPSESINNEPGRNPKPNDVRESKRHKK